MRRALVLLALLALASPALAQISNYGRTTVGYAARSCGLDMDRNGTPGEAADCNVCDGSTTDPDGDTTAEDLIYVDASSGVNNGTCGTVGSPCATIVYALETRADGPGDGAEDIICAKGTFTTESDWQPPSGVAGYITVAQEGHQARAFRVPQNPAMIVGWDSDNDGSYPPFDTDDTCVIDGSGLGDVDLFSVTAQDYIEFAHCTVQNYAGAGTNFLYWTPTADADYYYFHDLKIANWNKDQDLLTGALLFSFFGGAGGSNWVWLHNIDVPDNGSYFARGGCTNFGADGGPFRFTNIHRTAHPSDGPTYPAGIHEGYKVWGYCSGIEILDSIFDGNAGAYVQNTGTTHSAFAAIAQCSQDVVIRGNSVINIAFALAPQPWASGSCIDRSVGPITFEYNTVSLIDYQPAPVGPMFIRVSDSNAAAPNAVISTLTIKNNIFYTNQTLSWFGRVEDQGGDGTYDIQNNTFVLKSGGSIGEFLQIDDAVTSWTVSKNVFDPVSATTWDRIPAHGAWWVSDYNVFSPFTVSGYADLAAWQSGTGDDANSDECTPTYVNAAGDDYRISGGDTCANPLGAGADPNLGGGSAAPGVTAGGVSLSGVQVK